MTEEFKPSKYKIVTSLNYKMWQKFAHKTVGTLIDKYKDTDHQVYMWFDTDEDFVNFSSEVQLTPNFGTATLQQTPPFVDFARKFDGDIPFSERGIDKTKIDPGAAFRYNYMPFAKKVYSWALTYFNLQVDDVLVWVDADITVNKKIEDKDFDALLPEGFDVSFLDRDRPWYAAETGFFMIRRTTESDMFVSMVLNAYATGFVFDMAEWHDGFVFKTLLKMCTNIKALNLNPVLRERDVFERTMLADFMTHFKGGLKNQLKDGQQQQPQDNTLIEYDPEEQGF